MKLACTKNVQWQVTNPVSQRLTTETAVRIKEAAQTTLSPKLLGTLAPQPRSHFGIATENGIDD